jgi:putative transposase
MAKSVRTARASMSYVTTTTCDRRPVFEISRTADLFLDTLLHYRTLGYYKLHAYVIMPDHVHLVLTPQSITLDQAVALIKNGFAYRLDSDQPIWQEGFTAYSIASIHDLEVVRAHLHQVPVRAGLTTAAELYRHSSAYRQVPVVEVPLSPSHSLAKPAAARTRKAPPATAPAIDRVAS